MIRTTTWPASWNSRSLVSTTVCPRWMSGAVGSIPSFTRSGRPSFRRASSAPAGNESTALRVSHAASELGSGIRPNGRLTRSSAAQCRHFFVAMSDFDTTEQIAAIYGDGALTPTDDWFAEPEPDVEEEVPRARPKIKWLRLVSILTGLGLLAI